MSGTSRSDRRQRGERSFEVDGRRWRTTDPGLDEDVRQSLVNGLMDGRRWVRDAKRSGDTGELRAARAQVALAKTALGERGQPWWEIEDDGLDERRVHALAAVLRMELRRDITFAEAMGYLVDGM